ncbi:uncharacterized protein LOC106663760 isoform X2 [Cimex lectularius]|uniref:Zinc finger PHD-type domain-containing protein n=1 Tax=Cimex lectularius TaxID=79782 RepID=A0A8I6TEM3_CIMLE|nr:uncharacterized protein LOC106663760 isoform X2 [Cimex lectularius]
MEEPRIIFLKKNKKKKHLLYNGVYFSLSVQCKRKMLAIKGVCAVCLKEVNIMTPGVVCFNCEKFYHGLCQKPQLSLHSIENHVTTLKQWYCGNCRRNDMKIDKRAPKEREAIRQKLQLLSQLRLMFLLIERTILELSDRCKAMEKNAERLKIQNDKLRERIKLHEQFGRKPRNFAEWVALRRKLKIKSHRVKPLKPMKFDNRSVLKQKSQLKHLIRHHKVPKNKRRSIIKIKPVKPINYSSVVTWVQGQSTNLQLGWALHLVIWVTIVVYTLLGALFFRIIEGRNEQNMIDAILKRRGQLINGNFSDANSEISSYYDFLEKKFSSDMNLLSRNDEINWNFVQSIFFCTSTYTTLGNHYAPKTSIGKFAVIVYSLFGIPLFFIFLSIVGVKLAHILKILLPMCCRKRKKKKVVNQDDGNTDQKDSKVNKDNKDHKDKDFKEKKENKDIKDTKDPKENKDNQDPKDNKNENNKTDKKEKTHKHSEESETTGGMLLLYVFIEFIYILLGAIYFWQREKQWKLFDAWYFVHGMLLTISFGDFIPNEEINLIVTVFYIFVGLALMAMGISLTVDWIQNLFFHGNAKLGHAAKYITGSKKRQRVKSNA